MYFLDLKKLKFVHLINIKVRNITHLPYNIEPENVKPIYTEFKGWKEDLN